jgi:hypothetical protein
MRVSKVVYGASLGAAGLVSAISILMMIMAAFPKFAEITRLARGAEIYKEVIRKPISKLLFGTELDLPWTGALFDAGALWISLFAAINIFIYRNEGVLLWGHIYRNYCRRSAPTEVRRQGCTLAKWLFALIATPFASIHLALKALRSNETLLTSCYITTNPATIVKYFKTLGLAISASTAILTILFQLFKP